MLCDRSVSVLTGEDLAGGHLPLREQRLHGHLALQLGCALEVNYGLAWPVHLLRGQGVCGRFSGFMAEDGFMAQ